MTIKNVKIRDVCNVVPGFAFKSSDFADSGVPVIKIASIRDDLSVSVDSAQCIPDALLSERHKKFILKDGDIVVAMTGATAGKLGRIRTDQPLLLNQRVAKIEPFAADPYYIWCILSGSAYRQRFFYLAGGSAQPNISGGQIEETEIPLPPSETQRRISATLKNYSDLIANNNRRIELLERSARLLFEEWFVRLRYPGHEQDKIVAGVPNGWRRGQLYELCTDVRYQILPEKVGAQTPYIGLEHIPRRSVTLSEWGTASQVESSKFVFSQGDILFGKIRPYFHKVGFAITDGITSSDTIVVRAHERAWQTYTLHLLSSDGFVALASKAVKEGSKMPRADWKFLQRQTFTLPPEEMREAFDKFASPMLQQLRVLAWQNRKLKEARDLLLPRLMDGRIEV